MARARARRWPSDRSRGWRSGGMPGSTPLERARGRPRRQCRRLVRRLAFGVHALSVEEKSGVLGHQPDVTDEIGGPERPWVPAVDRDGAPRRPAHPGERVQQRGLPRTVPPHERQHLAGHDREVHPVERRHRSVGNGQLPRRRRLDAFCGRGDWRSPSRWCDRCQPLAERSRHAGGRRGRKGERVPADEPAQLDQRRGDRGRPHHDLGRPDDERRSATGHQNDPVGERHDPLQPVFRHDDGEAQIVHQAGQCAQDLFGRGRIEGGRGLVEDQQPRRRGQHRPDRHALLLTARQRPQ